jgi:hypothetical protein
MRNKFIDRTINLLNNVKYVPNKDDVALNAIIDNPALSDQEKLVQMRDYYKGTMIENAFNAAVKQAEENHNA